MGAAEERADEAVAGAADELYGLPLADFTRARDDLAKRLRREGRRDDAEAVKALRKPTVAAWALNQLARRRPKDLEKLLATGERLRQAQETLLGGGDRSALRRATAEERELVAKLARDASALAGESGTGATASLGERIASTLHAAALDEQTAAELAAGRLLREREAVGLFGADSVEVRPGRRAASAAGSRSPAAESPAAAAPPGRPARRRGARAGPPAKRQASDERARQADERRREAERELAAARAQERKAQREHAAAGKATERADKRVRDAQTRADEAREKADEARAGLREAKRSEREAAKAHQRATRAVAAAEKRLG
jgi:hypothetical protein